MTTTPKNGLAALLEAHGVDMTGRTVTIDTTESVGPLPVGYVEPAEDILSDEEREPVQAFHIGDLVRITAFTMEGEYAKVIDVYAGAMTVRLIFGDDKRGLMFWPDEVKLVRSHEKPGWKPLQSDLYRPRVYKDKSDGKWITEDDIRLSRRFRIDGNPAPYRVHNTYSEALATVREQAALDQAKRDAVEISAKGIVA
jgi:hypothetical protein